MKNDKKKQIKDFKKVLKDIEPHVKDPQNLKTGRDFKNFSLRAREIWANWLLCVVMKEVSGKDITFAEDEEGDGIILEKGTGDYLRTEHVSALKVPSSRAKLKGEARIIDAINLKIKRGKEYAKNKTLIVFFEDAGKFYPNKVGKSIYGKHSFKSVFGIGLLEQLPNGYKYSVSRYEHDHSPTWIVEVDFSTYTWKVLKLQ